MLLLMATMKARSWLVLLWREIRGGGGVFVLKKATLLLERIHINNINTNVYVVETRMEWGAVILFLATILANTGIQASSYLNQFAVFVPAGKF